MFSDRVESRRYHEFFDLRIKKRARHALSDISDYPAICMIIKANSNIRKQQAHRGKFITLSHQAKCKLLTSFFNPLHHGDTCTPRLNDVNRTAGH